MKWICNAVTKAAQPLSSAWASWSRLQYYIQKRSSDTSDQSLAPALVPLALGEEPLNLSEVIDQLQLGIKIIGMASVQCIQKWRLDL